MKDVNILDSIIKIATLVFAIFTTCIVAVLNRRNMRFESFEKMNRFKMDKQLEAGMAFWGLLSYATEVENENAILIWKREKGSNETQWFFRKKQANEFISKLNEVNYEKGHGFFLSADTRQHFYNYRSKLYGLCLVEKSNSNELIPLKEGMATELRRLYGEMNNALRKELEPEKHPNGKEKLRDSSKKKTG